MKVLVCHPGTQHAGKLAVMLQRQNSLGGFVTGFRPRPDSFLARRLRLSGLRSLEESLAPVTTQIRAPEVFGKLAQCLGWKGERLMRARNAWFQKLIPARMLAASDAVIGFDTASWILAQRARGLGKPFVLDRAAVHRPARVKLRAQFGAIGFGAGEREDIGGAQDRCEAAEVELASRVVVASRFSEHSLLEAGVAREKVAVIPYGVNWDFFAANGPRTSAPEKVVFLFVGLLKAEKGVGVLLDAWQRLAASAAELWIAGVGDDALASRARGMAGVKLLGKLGMDELRAAYSGASVFVFPTLCDGFGMVLLEAMAAGLPLIATPNCAAPELIEGNGSGEIVPPGDAVALAAAMAAVIANPAAWTAKGNAARESARAYSWEGYGEKWNVLLQEVVA